ncbi:hypothetical protein H9L11_08020 [Vibrio sp. sp1]|uniref:hypothetical protein n=1 Tax=Vibrio TaxID=662 RepID=UPI0019657AC1|nr:MULTISPECIES: hypothetical protein [Vibrio]MDA0420461.1 hypothetical protein [Vibrio alginolyticus]QRZ21187.1 hypothetical protein H9L11_08020 [Vibrio sp. sp1]
MTVKLNEPKTIVFHPGMGKTATSAIQLAGLAIPNDDIDIACFSPYGVLGDAHNAFASNHPLFDHETFEIEWKKLLTYAKQRNSSTIISTEFLIRDNPQHIKRLIEDCYSQGLNVKVIVAIRNYTDYLTSAFLQAVKVNWGIKSDENLFLFSQRELNSIRLNQLIDVWSRHIGDHNTYIIDYDKHKTCFLELFFKQFSIKLDRLGIENKEVNSSIPLAVAPMLRHFDRVNLNPKDRERFIEMLKTFDYKPAYQSNTKARLQSDVVKNSYLHDLELIKARYHLID